MRLIEPGVGEILDRLTILSLKILFGESYGRDTTHFKTERTTLLAKIRSRTLNGAWFDCALDLAAVNAALWHAEDDLRHLRTLPDAKRAEWSGFGPNFWQETGALAFRIQELNDRRAALVAEINKLAGEASAEEKLT